MNQFDLEQTIEQNEKLEKLIESLIAMLGRSNQRLDDLTVRLGQLEQYMVEAAPFVPPSHEESFSVIARTGNTVP